MRFIRQILESFRFAWQALRSNLLRTMLSLLGVTIGIFAIIAVFTVVDSMERNINGRGNSAVITSGGNTSNAPNRACPSTAI